MEERETGHTLEKRHDSGTGVKAVLIHAPCLQCAAGDVKHLGRLTLGDTLGVQIIIPSKQGRTFEARPALVTSSIAIVFVWDYRCHSSLLFQPFALHSRRLRMARELS